MNEQEAKKALFDLTREYMSHKPKERKKLYSQKAALARTIVEQKTR